LSAFHWRSFGKVALESEKDADGKIIQEAPQGSTNGWRRLGATIDVEAIAAQCAAPVVKALLGKTVILRRLSVQHRWGRRAWNDCVLSNPSCDTFLIAGSTMPWLHYYPFHGNARTNVV
jgi:hypothetical protein